MSAVIPCGKCLSEWTVEDVLFLRTDEFVRDGVLIGECPYCEKRGPAQEYAQEIVSEASMLIEEEEDFAAFALIYEEWLKPTLQSERKLAEMQTDGYSDDDWEKMHDD